MKERAGKLLEEPSNGGFTHSGQSVNPPERTQMTYLRRLLDAIFRGRVALGLDRGDISW